MRTSAPQSGFSTIELIATLGIIGVVAAAAVPSMTSTLADLRLRGDARGVHNAVALAKMRAAAHFTRERLYVEYQVADLGYWARDIEPELVQVYRI